MHDHFTEQRCPVVLFIMLYKAILTLESVDKILKCDHSTFLWCCGLIWFTVLKTGSLDTCNAMQYHMGNQPLCTCQC